MAAIILTAGSVASPFRETEAMKDGSDAVADWPLLNALLNTASGASWVSIHNGGGVGIGYSQHAGQVTVADGTDDMARRIERVLTNDPGIGVARHVDAGYEEAKQLRGGEGNQGADGGWSSPPWIDILDSGCGVQDASQKWRRLVDRPTRRW